MRIKTYTRNNYIFKEYSGNYQKIKYDRKKDDYFITYKNQKFYFNDCIPWTSSEATEDKNVIGTWQEGYSVYLLKSKDDKINFTDSSLCKIVYCPPAT